MTNQFKLSDVIYNRIDRISNYKRYPFYLTLFLTACTLFFSFPRYDQYRESEANWEVVMLKASDLTNNLSHIDPGSWLAKKVFRLTVPVFIKIFHLNRPAVIAIQFVLGILLIYYSYLLARRLLNDGVAATFVSTGLVFLYIGRTGFTDIAAPWFDAWAYLFLLLALLNTNALFVFLFAFMASWVDERAILVLPALVIFHQLRIQPPGTIVQEVKHFLMFNKSSIAIVGAGVVTIALRLYLTAYVNMKLPLAGVSFDFVKENLFVSGFGILTFFEGFWLLLPVMLFVAYRNSNYFLLILVCGQVAISSIGALFVYDITRSGSYLFPILFVWLMYLGRHVNTGTLRSMLLAGAFFCFIFPPINFISQWQLDFAIEKPMLFVLYKLLGSS